MELSIAAPFQCLFDEDDPNYHKRYIVFYGGRGSGKTVTIAKALLLRGYRNKERILCCREYQNSISDSVLKTLEDEIEVLGLQSFYKVQNNGIFGLNGTEFIFKGVKNNIQSIKSMAGITIVWPEEAQTVSDRSWDVLIPTIRSEGSQFFISFNPDEEDDPTYQRFVVNPPPNSHIVKVNYDENPWFPTTLREEMEYQKSKDTELYNHIWLGQTRRAGLGAVYGKEMADALEDNRITNVPYTPAAPVNTYWDLGWADQTAIWFGQTIGKEPRAIDYYESNLESLDHYVAYLRSKPYNYGYHVLPHDAEHKSLRTGKTLTQQLREMGLENVITLPIAEVKKGIELSRQLIPQMWFDADKCKQGIHCLRKYHYKFDEDRKVFSKEPLHDWSSNGSDAYRYMATYLSRNVNAIVKPENLPYYRQSKGFM